MAPTINPKWSRLGRAQSIEAALRRLYKPDRLGELGDRARQIRAELDRDEGLTVLASRHESVTGRALWILELDGRAGFEIYQSDK